MAADAPCGIDMNNVRTVLETRRRELTRDLAWRRARLREQETRPVEANEPEEPDSSDLDVSLVEIAATTLRQIDGAIRRLERGSYGLCARCSGPIAEGRLRALPFALHCRECETRSELEAGRGLRVFRNQPWRVSRLGERDELDAL